MATLLSAEPASNITGSGINGGFQTWPEYEQDPSSPRWTRGLADELQLTADSLIGKEVESIRNEILNCEFSFSISDPQVEDCPLIACTTGFSRMCGYEIDEIVGRNCRFLVDPVPQDYVNQETRQKVRDFCTAVANGPSYALKKQEDVPDWVTPQGTRTQGDGLFCVQVNARKDCSLFRNMFYLKEAVLGEKSYIIGLQTEVEGLDFDDQAPDYQVYQAACRRLDRNMGEVERILSKMFWFSAAMRRQTDIDEDDGFRSDISSSDDGSM